MDDKKRYEYSASMPPPTGRSSPVLGKRTDSNIHGASSITNSPIISILAYCAASISMTIINKFCVSGKDFNLNFFFLAVQVCSFPIISSADSNIQIVISLYCRHFRMQVYGFNRESGEVQ